MLFADAALARRIEGQFADEMRRFVEAARAGDYPDAALLEIGGGVAVYLWPGCPVNQAVGLGLSGKVSAEEIAQIESFYHERGQRPFAVLAPHAHHSALARMAQRGWHLDGSENVLVREFGETLPVDAADCLAREGGDEPSEAVGGRCIEVAEVTDTEGRAVWSHVAATAFSAPLDPLPQQLELARLVTTRPGARLFLALVDGRPAGTGELFIDDGVAWLSADSTLPQMRRRGVQAALQRARLSMGQRAGCELAVSESAPGSGSQRNMERLGFRVAYTRAEMLGPSATR